jgi:flagellar basal-body rod protein FlgC
MSNDAIFAVTRFGLDFERARMEAASQRIATADIPLAQRAAIAGSQAASFAGSLGTIGNPEGKPPLAADTGENGEREVMDPSNPLAGADGMVRFPNVDMAQEMTTLMSAQRAYQADIRAFNTLHGMLMKSLDIGH